MSDSPLIPDYATPETERHLPRGRVEFEHFEHGIRLQISPVGFWRYHARMPAPFWTLLVLVVLVRWIAGWPMHQVDPFLGGLCGLHFWWLVRQTRTATMIDADRGRVTAVIPWFWGRRTCRWDHDAIRGIRAVRLHRRHLGTMPFGELRLETRRPWPVRLLRGHDMADLEFIADALRKQLAYRDATG